MDTNRPRSPLPHHTRIALVACAMLTAVVGTLALGTGPATARQLAKGWSAQVDAYSGYDPQATCRPSPMPGTVALARWLQARYPGTGSDGMMRACTSGGTSEHKDGRAFDWAADVANPATRKAAYDFIERALATDAAGNANALARRLGIMYMIYDDVIYSAYRDFAPRPYLNAGCKQLDGCSRTLRHKDHVHISLGLAGAAAQTSWYRARGVDSVPVYYPGTRQVNPDDTAVTGYIAPSDGSRTTSPFKLKAGVTYRVVVSGVVRTGVGDAVADANCTWQTGTGWVPADRGPLPTVPDPTVPDPTVPDPGTTDGSGGWTSQWGAAEGSTHPATPAASVLEQTRALTVRGAVRWDDPGTCQADHTYQAWYTPTKVQRLRVKFADPTPADNDGTFTVYVARDDITRHSLRAVVPAATVPEPKPWRTAPTGPAHTRALVRETVALNTARSAGVVPKGRLRRGFRYRVKVTGTAVDTGTGLRFDGACVRYLGALRPQHSLDLNAPEADHFAIYVSGNKVNLHPVGQKSGCTRSHTYVGVLTSPTRGRTRVRVWDPFTYTDNRGVLTVKLTRLGR